MSTNSTPLASRRSRLVALIACALLILNCGGVPPDADGGTGGGSATGGGAATGGGTATGGGMATGGGDATGGGGGSVTGGGGGSVTGGGGGSVTGGGGGGSVTGGGGGSVTGGGGGSVTGGGGGSTGPLQAAFELRASSGRVTAGLLSADVEIGFGIHPQRATAGALTLEGTAVLSR